MNAFVIELIGYLGSALVLISFLMVSVYKLRVINSLGSVACVIYGLIIHAYPTVVMNLALLIINIYYLVKMINTQKNYDMIKANVDDTFVKYTIGLYKEDIEKCFPGISFDFNQSDMCFVICHEGKPVGITVGELKGYDLDMKLDYSIPAYRDFSIGQFLFSKLSKEGIDRVQYRGAVVNHKTYLEKIGFEKKEGYYEKKL